MPVDQFKVEEAHKFIRDFYKGQIKSSNKMYADAKQGGQACDALRKKQALRNSNLETALKHIGEQRDLVDKMTLYDYANHLIEARYAQRIVVGNCFEMALLAAYYCWESKIGVAWIASISESGDHAFCVVGGEAAPDWKTVAALKDDKSDRWVIDPWANVCCRAADYETQFKKKMEAWTSQGKRLLVRTGLGREWIVPNSEDYLSGFAGGLLGFVKFVKKKSANPDKKLG